MRFLVRQDQHPTQAGSGTPMSDDLDAVRARGDDLLSAGQESISRALNRGNSEDFLRASRQEGGE